MGRYLVLAMLVIGLLTSSGCCWWADHWCPHPVQACAPPPGYYQAAPACGCAPPCTCAPGYPTSYSPPAAPVTPPPNWNQPRPMNCNCTCNP